MFIELVKPNDRQWYIEEIDEENQEYITTYDMGFNQGYKIVSFKDQDKYVSSYGDD